MSVDLLRDHPVDAAPRQDSGRSRWGERAPLLLYTLTGFTGLLAEQGFEKYTALLVGATASASAVVLFTYFLGFALGALAAGRLLKTGRIVHPFSVYGAIELLVGISCVAFSYSFHSIVEALTPLQNLLGAAGMRFQARFLCGCILILPTAALMGASFPLIATVLDSADSRASRRWTHAYTANLAGALLAALTAPLVIMPVLGLRGSFWLCFALSAIVCVVALRYRRMATAGSTDVPTVRAEAPAEVRGMRLLLAAAFASGAVFFALEVIWTHLVGVVIGCSIYAFSWMLAAVLLGLWMGAVLVSRGFQANPARLFQWAALLLMVQLYLWVRVPQFFELGPPAAFQGSFYFAEVYKLLIACLQLTPSSIALGLIYPMLLASPQLQGETRSYLAGYISAANSLGCLTGALLGVFVLIPGLGSELSLKAISMALAAFWLLFLRQERPSARRLRLAAVTAICAVAFLGVMHWEWGPLTAGTGNYYGHTTLPGALGPGVRFTREFIFRDESLQGGLTTVVLQKTGTPPDTTSVRTMFTNGKFEGDDDVRGQINAQFGFAAIPSLFVNHFDRALLIGLGTGHSAAAVKHLGYREIDIAEFAPGIVAAARQSFAHLNDRVLDDPHVRLFLEDGRNVLLTDTGRSYDLITIEVTSVWFAGATNLYSQQFYETARKRLNPDGVLQQWVQLHHIGPRELATVLATARAVFPHVGLWLYGGQGMLVASGPPLVRDEGRRPDLDRRFRSDRLVDELYGAMLVSPDGVNRLVHELHPPINTDHNRWLEYATPHYQSSSFDWFTSNRRFLSQYRD
jgi:spermidine synthase